MYEILKKIDFFSLLNNKEIEAISNSCQIVTLTKENILFYEGDIANSFYILIEGNLKLYKTDSMGNEIIMHNFSEPMIIAEMASFQNSAFPATAICVSEYCSIAILEKDIFISLLRNNADLSFHIIGSLVKKMKSLEQNIHRNLIYNSTQKVCALLKDEPDIFTKKKNVEIARLINMAPETLSRNIKKLRSMGYLNEKNRVIDFSFLKTLTIN
ncbi:Crp/Fnr family transcriptional regulator [Arcobacter cloacae]|uniref:Uncharacterized protein n=1 Tax=Arcobacter cloacae TaxID=1054034 RepID=A0A6M8NKL2_9BACT|nr:Crp/Fnr family transcriptional regulator [Arcobacter cloacae]QKF91099.1 transcriptional regulator, Crp/Fnr family [Arcobacter cloacae]RXI38932.1 hypothetical protein CP963_11035 [Arcobacter cloacae]